MADLATTGAAATMGDRATATGAAMVGRATMVALTASSEVAITVVAVTAVEADSMAAELEAFTAPVDSTVVGAGFTVAVEATVGATGNS